MTEFDRVDNSNNFNFRGFPLFLQVCEKGSQATRKKDGVCTVMVLLYIYRYIGVRLPICPVIIPLVFMPTGI